MRFEPRIEPRLNGLARSTAKVFVGDNANARPQQFFPSVREYSRVFGLTSDRVTGMMAPGPHTAFATDETKQLLSAALRKWIR